MANDDLLLVGSIPLETVEDVFRSFGAKLGPHLRAMPDGEVGPRSHWISRVHYQVLTNHPDFEVVNRPAPENGVERLAPRGPAENWKFRLRDGVEQVRFGDPGWRLGVARDAINSYFVFKTLRKEGVLPEGLRFQISLPSVNSALAPRIFPQKGDLEKIKPGYEAAVKAELENIVAHIPAEDLAIQWDCSTEMQDAYGAIPELGNDGDTIERNVGQFRRLSPVIPEGALLGYHLCFGTLGGWPRFEPDDLSGAVAMANAFAADSGRRVDWLHIPALPRDDEAFFAPLANLKSQGAKVYLGLIHHMDGFEKRVAMARKFLPDFGVAAYCGFGRQDPSALRTILDDHLKAASAV